jgi:hypothetical protein
MSDPIEATTAIAKAVERTASLLEGTGKFFAPILKDYLGLHGADKLYFRRMENIARMAKESQVYVESLDPKRISEPSPSVLLPLLKASADEERKELRDLWAKLLANAAIDGGTKVRREFFETVKNMEPIDALILETFDHPTVANPNQMTGQISAIANLITPKGIEGGLNNVNVQIGVEALQKLGCLGKGSNISPWALTAYGKAFREACKVM